MTTDRSLPTHAPSVRPPRDEAALQPQWLAVSSPDGEIWFAPLLDTPLTIGRGRSCDLVLDDERVSRVHASVDRIDDALVVIDLDSTNGIALNGLAVDGRNTVAIGDTIDVGGHSLRLVDSVDDDVTAPGWTTD